MNTLTRHNDTWISRTSASPPASFLRRLDHYLDAEIDNIADLLAVRPPSRILETGCGAGIRTLELARRGYRMVGIDPVAWRIAAARGRVTDPALDVSFYRRHANAFVQLDSFDAAIASFAPGQDKLDDRRILLNLSVSLRPGGRLLLDATVDRYSPSSIAEALVNAGFAKVEVFGSLDRTPYDARAKRLYTLTTK
ncbi:MAG TPA: class I SAM-dependent methyltransferase [Sedimentisphaerales bacterium]|nr:class I SAM-dependent methyltransferase [Sedimentisphaerales bacterium]